MAGTLVTVAFVGAHALLAAPASDWNAVAAWSVLGIAALALRLASGSVLPAIVVHAGYNASLLLIASLLAYA